MTPSQKTKQAGLKNLAELSQITQVPVSTLKHWDKHDPDRFEAVLDWAVVIKETGLVGKRSLDFTELVVADTKYHGRLL